MPRWTGNLRIVLLQIKHGPFDFQVREPPLPLLLAMPRTARRWSGSWRVEYTWPADRPVRDAGDVNEVLADMPAGGIQSHGCCGQHGDGSSPDGTRLRSSTCSPMG